MQVYEPHPLIDSTPHRRWILLPYFVLRQAGFPFAWLDVLASPGITLSLDQILTVQNDVVQAREQALHTIHQALTLHRASLDQVPEQVYMQRRLKRLREKILHNQIIEEDALAPLRNQHVDVYDTLTMLNTFQKRLDNILEHFLHEYGDYSREVQEQLAQLFSGDDHLRLALLMSNESSFKLFDKWLSRWEENTAKSKQFDRNKVKSLIMYLQRFCSKNDTASHFGPFSLGRVQEGGPSVTWNENRDLERIVFFAHWAAEAIAEKISADPLLFPFIKPRRNPKAVVKGTTLQLMDFASRRPWYFRLGPIYHPSKEEQELLMACDGSLTITELISRHTKDDQEYSETAIRLLRKLQQIGALFLDFEVPVGSPLPLADLREALTYALPKSQPWLDVIEIFEHELQRFAEADLRHRQSILLDLKKRFEQITGVPAERGHGNFYADRAILFEECQRHLHLTIGGDVLAAIKEELGVFLDLQLLPTHYRFAAEQNLTAEWFHKTFGKTAQIPLIDYLERFSLDDDMIKTGMQRIDTEMEKLYRAIDHIFLTETNETHEREISLDTIKQFVDRYDCLIPVPCNPDLMLIAESQKALNMGAFRILVGECHSIRELLSQSGFGPIVMDQMPQLPLDIYSHYQQLLEKDEIIADIITIHNEKTISRLKFDCIDVEASGLSPKPRSRVLPISDLFVKDSNGKLRLSTQSLKSSPRYIKLLAPFVLGTSICNDPLVIFSFPRLPTGMAVPGIGHIHLPRIVVGRTVLQREIWRVQAQDLLAGYSLFHKEKHTLNQLSSVRAMQKHLGMPRYVFAKINGERKPIFVDFEAPFLVEQLIRLVRRNAGVVEFSEMLPGPHDLWLEYADGKVCCEFRLSLFSRKKLD